MTLPYQILPLPNRNFTRARPFWKGSPSPGEIGTGARNISLARMKCVTVQTFNRAEPVFLEQPVYLFGQQESYCASVYALFKMATTKLEKQKSPKNSCDVSWKNYGRPVSFFLKSWKRKRYFSA